MAVILLGSSMGVAVVTAWLVLTVQSPGEAVVAVYGGGASMFLLVLSTYFDN